MKDPGGVPAVAALKENASRITIKLIRSASLSGLITNSKRLPVAGARVFLMSRLTAAGLTSYETVADTTADEKGAYRLPSVVPGSYFLAALPTIPPANAQPKPNASTSAPVLTFYPSGEDDSGALPIQLAPGDKSAQANVSMLEAPLRSISGKLSVAAQKANEPGTALYIQLTRLTGHNGSVMRSGGKPTPALSQTIAASATGEFAVHGLAPGSYRVSTYVKRTLVRLGTLEIAKKDLTGLSFEVPPLAEVHGKVVWVDAAGSSTNKPRMMNWRDVPEGSTTLFGRLADDDKFQIADALAGKYRVMFAGSQPEFYVKSITVGGRKTEGATVDLPPLATIDVEVEVARMDSWVRGRTQGKAAKATVTAPDATDNLAFLEGRFAEVPVSPVGIFESKKLPPGSYRVCAWGEDVTGEMIMKTLLEKQSIPGGLPLCELVDIKPSEAKVVSLKPMRMADLEK